MATHSITSWQIDGETMETVTDFIFLVFQIIANGDYSHEIKRLLLLGRKAMTKLDSLLKMRDFANKGPYSQSLEKAMAPHSSTLAWKTPWTEEPGRLQSMGSLGVGHDREISL